MPTFKKLWDSHPYPDSPCAPKFENQCAIRMTVALHGAGINTALLSGVRCWHNHTSPSHILRAQQFAEALARTSSLLGAGISVVKKKGTVNDNLTVFSKKKGVVFIKDGWGSTDHIDLWDGLLSLMKGSADTQDYMSRGKEVWFWEME